MTPSVMKNDKSWRGMLLKVFIIGIITILIGIIINMIIIIAISANSHWAYSYE